VAFLSSSRIIGSQDKERSLLAGRLELDIAGNAFGEDQGVKDGVTEVYGGTRRGNKDAPVAAFAGEGMARAVKLAQE
jgi:hypothetical protein